jgi:hypothetical protein
VTPEGEVRILKGRGCLVHTSRNRAAVDAANGFDQDGVVEACAMIHRVVSWPKGKTGPPSLGLVRSVAIGLSNMGRNRVPQEPAGASEHAADD